MLEWLYVTIENATPVETFLGIGVVLVLVALGVVLLGEGEKRETSWLSALGALNLLGAVGLVALLIAAEGAGCPLKASSDYVADNAAAQAFAARYPGTPIAQRALEWGAGRLQKKARLEKEAAQAAAEIARKKKIEERLLRDTAPGEAAAKVVALEDQIRLEKELLAVQKERQRLAEQASIPAVVPVPVKVSKDNSALWE